MMELNSSEDQNLSVVRFEKMLKTNELFFFDADEFEFIICHYLETGKTFLANKAIKIALSQHPESSALKLLQVEILMFEDQLEEALEVLDYLFDIEPYNPELYIQKANICSKRSHHQEAINILEESLELSNYDEEVYALIAMEYMFLENYEKAKEYYMKCLEIDEEDSAALYNIMYCFDYLGQTTAAIAFLSNYIEKFPYSEIAWHQLGLQYVETHDLENALTCFDYAIISDTYFVGAYMEKAKVLEEMERFSEAIESYEMTLSMVDPTAFAYLHIANCYEQLKNDHLALKFYNKALQEDPLLDKTWLAITDFYTQRNKYKKALYYIERAISIDEENPMYWEKLRAINKHLKELEVTEKSLRKSPEIDKYDFETSLIRCDILIGMEELKMAIEEMEEASYFYPNQAQIEYRLAGLYYTLSNEEEGIIHLKKALQIDCEYAIIMENLFPKIFGFERVQELLKENGFFD